MEIITPFLIAFTFIFLSELGDKTQLLVLSFSAKLKTFTILIGIALGSFFSHGLAILFGSFLGNINNSYIESIVQVLTYFSFIAIGIYIIFFQKEKTNKDGNNSINKLSHLKLNYIFIIAFSIAIGELGDKTFLASLGLGVNYPDSKLSLIIGAVSGMIASDCIAIFLGKLLSTKLNTKTINKLSGLLFLIFGFIGIIFL